ncbi:MAG: AIR synthase-related protein, partial [Pseudomonadota bacterium]
GGVDALANITGGGITENLPRVLPENLSAEIDKKSWQMPELFNWLKETGNINEAEMLRTFNCGIGMILVVEKSQVDLLKTVLENHGEKVSIIGKIIAKQKDKVVYL